MKHFVKNSALGFVSIPGVGPLKEGTVLVGDSFEKYSPRFLTEVMPPQRGMPLESRQPQTAPVLLTEPSPVPSAASAQPEQLEEEVPGVSEPVKRGRGRPRKYPLTG